MVTVWNNFFGTSRPDVCSQEPFTETFLNGLEIFGSKNIRPLYSGLLHRLVSEPHEVVHPVEVEGIESSEMRSHEPDVFPDGEQTDILIGLHEQIQTPIEDLKIILEESGFYRKSENFLRLDDGVEIHFQCRYSEDILPIQGLNGEIHNNSPVDIMRGVEYFRRENSRYGDACAEGIDYVSLRKYLQGASIQIRSRNSQRNIRILYFHIPENFTKQPDDFVPFHESECKIRIDQSVIIDRFGKLQDFLMGFSDGNERSDNTTERSSGYLLYIDRVLLDVFVHPDVYESPSGSSSESE